GSPRGGHELARSGLRTLGESRAPREAPTIVGHLAELELDDRPEMPQVAQARAVGFPFTLVLGVHLDLEARVDTLGVRGQEMPEPASDFRVGPAGEHGVDSSRGRCLNWDGADCRPRPRSRSALVEAAREALLAAFLVDERRLTALLAEVAELLARIDGHRKLGRTLRPAHLPAEDAAQPDRPRAGLGRAET